MKLIPVFLLAALCFADDNRPASSLTIAERQAAYAVAVNRISVLLKAPSTAQYTPIQQAVFSTGKRNTIDVRLNVDAQNSFGAMLRKGWTCRVGPQRPDTLYPVFCFEAIGRIPKNAVRGFSGAPQPAPAAAPSQPGQLEPASPEALAEGNRAQRQAVNAVVK